MNFDINDLLDGGSSSRPRFEGDGGVSDTHVEGSVARIRYSNPSFTVASIRTNAGNLITFVGRFAITEGQTIRLEGVWKKNARFGWQFDAEAFTFNVDATDEAVATFLARHPDMTGIGPARAQAIVEALKATGQDLGEALETGDPAALAAATGEKVTAAMIATAQRAWGAQIDLNKVMLALARWEVTPAAAKRLERARAEARRSRVLSIEEISTIYGVHPSDLAGLRPRNWKSAERKARGVGWCSNCQREKSVEEFGSRGNGYCRDCHREYSQRYNRAAHRPESPTARRIRSLAEERPDLSLDELAEKVGCSRSWVWKCLTPAQRALICR